MIEQGDILTLDDQKKYVAVSILSLEGSQYVYLVNKENYKEFIIGELIGDSGVDEVDDPDLLETLIIKFNEELKESLPKIIEQYM